MHIHRFASCLFALLCSGSYAILSLCVVCCADRVVTAVTVSGGGFDGLIDVRWYAVACAHRNGTCFVWLLCVFVCALRCAAGGHGGDGMY